ncbi:MAG: hypothetical protein SFX72_07535 [Isosphaeraceae bacterium]|nr:hypothetical protein [Isosphaeraceae bacterium]
MYRSERSLLDRASSPIALAWTVLVAILYLAMVLRERFPGVWQRLSG